MIATMKKKKKTNDPMQFVIARQSRIFPRDGKTNDLFCVLILFHSHNAYKIQRERNVQHTDGNR